ncbi:MAG: cohesin domain-containing protein [Archaeoglobaceae archaeon]
MLSGQGINATPTDFGRANIYYSLDSNNEVKFYLDLKDYKSGNKVIDPGLYVFTVKLYLDSEEVDKVQKLVEILPANMFVTVEPETIVVGDKILVSVQTNREGDEGYDHIWVTMVGANYKAVQRITLDKSGKGTAIFETIDIPDGIYRFYVRDTMGTIAGITEFDLAEDLYDLDPANILAKTYKANDDLLLIKTIQIFKSPTPPPTTSAKIFIEPNKTTVAPGGIFAVDISVQDGTANSMLVNFTFDTSKISYVSGSKEGLFNTIDTISSKANYVKYLGVSSSPVSIASKTKVATAVFRVNSGASGTISFNVVTASVNGVNAMPIVQSIKIGTEPWQAYDSNGNGKIEDQELIAAIMDWLGNRISDLELINVIIKWLS